MKTKIRTYDVAEYLETEEDMVAYFEAVLEEGEPTLIVHALGAMARARGMTQIAKDTGLRRESLYKTFSSEGNPEFSTVLKVVKALGLKLHATTLESQPVHSQKQKAPKTRSVIHRKIKIATPV